MALIKKGNTITNKKSANKALLVIIIFVIVLIFIPVTSYLLRSKKSPSSAAIAPFTSVKAEAYTLSYPTDWTENESAGVRGGEVYYLQPPHADPTVIPHVILQISDASTENIDRMALVYLILKYHKETVNISGTVAQKYTAILPSVHGPFHSIAYVFTAKGNIYLLELGYTQKNTDSQLEYEFTQIVNNFTLQ
jgi:hypothetical protein